MEDPNGTTDYLAALPPFFAGLTHYLPYFLLLILSLQVLKTSKPNLMRNYVCIANKRKIISSKLYPKFLENSEVEFLSCIKKNTAIWLLNIRVSSSTKEATMKLYNVFGAQLMMNKLNGTTSTIPIKDLPAGIYYVQVNNGDQISKTKNLKQ